MPRLNSYLPSEEGKLRDWFVNFLGKLSAGLPADYGLSDDEASDFADAANVFTAAYAVAIDPATRTKLTIQAKNTAKDAAVEQARRTVAIVQAWPEMTDVKRDDLQITIRDTTPTPIGVPSEAPELSVESVQGRLLNLRLREPGSTRRAKPGGVAQAWLYLYVGETEPTDFGVFKFEGTTSRTDPQVVVDADVPAGSRVWLSACWANGKGQPGPACAPVSTWTNGASNQVRSAA
ncbi:MAG: hypothetical protein AAGF84_03515 [Planctomycetota bacterium]